MATPIGYNSYTMQKLYSPFNQDQQGSSPVKEDAYNTYSPDINETSRVFGPKVASKQSSGSLSVSEMLGIPYPCNFNAEYPDFCIQNNFVSGLDLGPLKMIASKPTVHATATVRTSLRGMADVMAHQAIESPLNFVENFDNWIFDLIDQGYFQDPKVAEDMKKIASGIREFLIEGGCEKYKTNDPDNPYLDVKEFLAGASYEFLKLLYPHEQIFEISLIELAVTLKDVPFICMLLEKTKNIQFRFCEMVRFFGVERNITSDTDIKILETFQSYGYALEDLLHRNDASVNQVLARAIKKGDTKMVEYLESKGYSTQKNLIFL